MKIVDLFCGMGGFSEGARQAGHEIEYAIDSDPVALEAHLKNHPTCRHILGNLPKAFEQVHLKQRFHVHASPPCQAFSLAAQDVTPAHLAASTKLMRWYLSLVANSNIQSWSMEQVSTPVTRKLLEEWKQKAPGRIDYCEVRADHYDVPQQRRRLVGGTPQLIQKLKKRAKSKDLSIEKAMAKAGYPLPARRIRNNTSNTMVRKNGEFVGYRPIEPTERLRPVSEPSYTVIASTPLRWFTSRGRYVRAFSPRESALMQTFPKKYKLADVCPTKYIGNAIPVKLAYHIASCIE